MVHDVNKDIQNAVDLADGYRFKYYTKLYARSNENLNKLFENFEVKDKKIFTVLGSSDQLFLAWYLGASKVDTFDINKLTIYYYYLRKWVIKEQQLLYPVDRFFEFNDSKTWEMIERVVPESKREEEAKYFWLTYLRKTNGLSNENLFFGMRKHSINIDFNKIINKLAEDINFINCSILDQMDTKEKYDVVIASNILEYTTSMRDYETFARNMLNLLNKNGLCVCSYSMNDHSSIEHKKEKEIIESMGFEAREFDCYCKNYWGLSEEVGYAYIKK